MALTIGVAALKGGAGKSTLAVNLACHLHSNGHRTLLVDGDSQATCRGWAAIAAGAERDTPPVVGMGAEMRRDLPRVASGFDAVVIDSPPRLSAEQRAAMLVSDLVLLPVTPGPADVWALQETLALLDEVRDLRPEIKAAIVLNRVSKRTSLATVTREAIDGAEIPVLKTTLGNRVAFGEAMATGQGVTTFAPSSAAAAEVTLLADEALQLLGARS
jgi:chromosome partitioning protein